MEVESDLLSNKSDDLVNDLLIIKRHQEKVGSILAILAQLCTAIIGIQLKTYKFLFPLEYSLNNLIFWRSLPIFILGYIFCRLKKIRITPHKEIKNKFWFYMRALGNYFVILIWIIFLMFFRVSTCQCVSCCSPILLIFLSIFILHEHFYMRYLYGVILCIGGTWLILLNEKNKNNNDNDNSNYGLGHMIMGILVGGCFLIFVSICVFGMKVMAKEGMGGDLQNYYLGMYNTIPAFLVVLFNGGNFGFTNIYYVIYALSNGLIFYLSNYLQTAALQNLSMVKYTPITYTSIVFTYLLGYLFLFEKVYFTDVIGSVIILGFQVYNVVYPVGKQIINKESNNLGEKN